MWTRHEVGIKRGKMRIEEFCEKLFALQCDWLQRSSTGKIFHKKSAKDLPHLGKNVYLLIGKPRDDDV